MSCHGNILNFIDSLPPGAWFATQQVLNLGTREAIDQTLHRLVKCGYLTRIAWGVFTLRFGEQTFEPLAVATFKAKMFKKKVTIHGLDIARRIGLIAEPAEHPLYSVYGVSSCFQSQKKEITLKSHSARKIALEGSSIGETISALWFLGRENCDFETVQTALRTLSKDDIRELGQSADRMPGWLTRMIRYGISFQTG
ncbi:MAG: DUF6088 family protein [Candidatus Obscuribacterales bacterium]|jgi:hypothetical protein